MRLVYLSPVPWASFAQRPHKFVEWFHAVTGGQVLWIDPYPARFPRWKDARRLFGVQHKSSNGYPPWLSVAQPQVLPIEPLPASEKLNGIFWKNIVKRIVQFSREENTIIGIGKPSALALEVLFLTQKSSSFYDAMDDFPAFHSGLSRIALERREKLIAEKVDRVIASSTALYKRWQGVNGNAKLVRNGLSPESMANFSGVPDRRTQEIFGYVGTMGNWFDWDLLVAFAELRPQGLFRLIGPVIHPIGRHLPVNVEILPPCDHASAMVAMNAFTVGLIPFKRNQLTSSVDPIKYYEYRALGLPVISSRFGEMEFRAEEEGTFLCDQQGDAGLLIDAALRYQPDEKSIQQFRINNTWSARFSAAGLLKP